MQWRLFLGAAVLIAAVCANVRARADAPSRADATVRVEAPVRADAPAPVIGDPAPALDTTTLDGAMVTRGRLLGRVTLIEFTTTWCGPCRASFIDLEALRARFGTRVDILLVDVQEPDDKLKAVFAKRRPPAGASIALDTRGTIAHAWGVDRFPTTFLVDRLGAIRHINRGHGGGTRQRLERWLTPMIAP